MRFQTSVRHFVWVRSRVCGLPSSPYDTSPFKCSSRSEEGGHFLEHHSKAKPSQTCQTQMRTKELLSNMSLMKQGPFKIYEKSFTTQLQWTVITLEFKIVASPFRKLSVLGVWRRRVEFPGD